MTDVVMPQMGESIVEGTLTRWLKKPGERIERDEPLFEISTDKVDTEIPSPAAGVLTELKKRQYFEKPSVKRKRKQLQAKKKGLRKLAEERRVGLS